MTEQLFSSYVDARNKKPVRRWWIQLALGLVCVLGFVVAAERLLRRSPYDDMVSRLSPNMMAGEVRAALGKSYTAGSLDVYHTGNPIDVMTYQVDGSNLPLIITFNCNISDYYLDRDHYCGGQAPHVDNWCVFVPQNKSQSGVAGGYVDLKLVCHKIGSFWDLLR